MSEKTACGSCAANAPSESCPYSSLPQFPLDARKKNCAPAPDDAECLDLWRKYNMLPNVGEHSMTVARIATSLAGRAYELGRPVSVRETRASALLHDIAKTWSVRYGGSHAQLGAAWVVYETGNYRIAQGVALHVHWPWKLPRDICILPLFVLYADKRVCHDKCVTIKERFDDLLIRYGVTEAAKSQIMRSWEQATEIERIMSEQLEWNLNEDSFDSGRLVK